jgi:nucleoside 2-deoxyribosyltransferase
MRVYLGGSSQQLGRVVLMAKRLEEAGVEVACRWWLDVLARDGAPDSSLSLHDQLKRAMEDWRHVREADCVLLLWPDDVSHGTAAELGYACGVDKEHVIVSGARAHHCIFTSVCARYEDDLDALEHVLSLRPAVAS